MTSRDFGYLTLRNTTAHNVDDTFVKENYVFTTSSYGKGKWTNSLVLNDLQVSTLEARAIETSSIQISSLIDSDGTTGDPGDVLHTNGSTIYWAPVGAGTGFWTANGNDIYNNNSGNVGIGISTPQFKLDVNGVARVGNHTGNTSSFEINFGTSGVGTYRSAFIYSDGTNMRINNQQDGNLSLYTNNFPYLSILSTGNVGIGTINPNYTLDVNGSFFASSISSQTMYDVAGQPGSANQVLTAGPSGNSVIWSSINVGTNYWSLNGSSIYNNNDSGNGSVGIGTNTPLSALDVRGDLNVSGYAISKVATSTITTQSSFVTSSLFGKYIFVNGDSVSTLFLPDNTGGSAEGDVVVLRNYGSTQSINVYSTISDPGTIIAGKTLSFVYTTLAPTGWYSL